MTERIVLVTGGRGYSDREKIYDVLDELDPRPGRLMQGGASGVDRIAAEWAKEHGVSCTTYPADWERWKKAAGPIRNKEMADVLANYRDEGCDVLVVAFPGGNGTANMIQEAESRSLPIYQVYGDD